MIQKIINLYTFAELSKEGQEKAVNNLRDINTNYQWWEPMHEDAEDIGLKITSFDLDRNRHAKGEFITSPGEVVEGILSKHGETCDTYKTAKKYKNSFQNTSDEVDKQELNILEDDFLNEILEDYSKILQTESEYLQSDDAIIETIEANEYTFTESGKLENL